MILQALFSLRPDAKFRWEGEDYNDIEWFDEVQTKPTLEELQVEADRLISQRQALQYQNKRLYEYPSIGDQLDALFHAGVFPAEMAAKIQAVKDKYPKE